MAQNETELSIAEIDNIRATMRNNIEAMRLNSDRISEILSGMDVMTRDAMKEFVSWVRDAHEVAYQAQEIAIDALTLARKNAKRLAEAGVSSGKK